jgi:hypothetical protein
LSANARNWQTTPAIAFPTLNEPKSDFTETFSPFFSVDQGLTVYLQHQKQKN